MIEEKTFKTAHHMILENRKNLTVSAVKDVDSFDEKMVVMYTQMGMLIVKGADLHINKFNMESGELILEGVIDQICYSDEEKRTASGFFTKLFK